MGMMIFRPGQRLVIPGAQVFQPRSSPAASTWWDNNGAISGCVAAYAPKGAADLAASYINLANPGTYNAAPGVAPTHSSADGWTFNGTSQYLTTGIVPASGYSMIVRFSNASATNRELAGVGNGTVRFYLRPRLTSADNRVYGYGSAALVAGVRVASGVMCVAGANGYYNGTVESGTAGSWVATTAAIFIGAANDSLSAGTAINLSDAKIQALAIYSTTLTAGQVATLTTLMNLI